jgi:hypothetical protein
MVQTAATRNRSDSMDDGKKMRLVQLLQNLSHEIDTLRMAVRDNDATIVMYDEHENAVITAPDVPFVVHIHQGNLAALLPAAQYSPVEVARSIPATMEPRYQKGEMSSGLRSGTPIDCTVCGGLIIEAP